ncbi:mitochondrial carrier domain-containing protein [Fusarium tricinctum]|uniref:Mitochondrial carrier domain-containing protein n=1 Tax=Fusarium tricinctum TaxID=61284 RepID=A0A8K0S5C2_9HYPO|nr:mitochondrial carrier domain-containing protein [Fusarium tricinctum]
MATAQDTMSKTAATAPVKVETATADAKKTTIRYPFWFGGSASSMAACVTHPLDLVKVRLQMRTGNAPKNMVGTFVHILRNDGPLGLYSGISASLLRQMTYSTVRFGVYEEVKTRLIRRNEGRDPSFMTLIALAAGSGFVGGIAGNFADVLNVRMQHDAALPPAERRNYRHAFDGMVRMAREEGPKSMFRGWLPNSGRAMFMTAGQLASYDVSKSLLLKYTPMEDNLKTHFTASFIAGLVAATITSPIDVIKTNVMSSTNDHNLLHLIRDIHRKHGVMWMFKGWVPSFLRLGPQTICTFVFLEMHRKAYRKLQGLDKNI